MGYYEGAGNGWDRERNKSVNAVRAEDKGYYPKSRWLTMSDRELSNVLACQYYIDDDTYDRMMMMSRTRLLTECLEICEAHHAGLFKQLVDYYRIRRDLEDY